MLPVVTPWPSARAGNDASAIGSAAWRIRTRERRREALDAMAIAVLVGAGGSRRRRLHAHCTVRIPVVASTNRRHDIPCCVIGARVAFAPANTLQTASRNRHGELPFRDPSVGR